MKPVIAALIMVLLVFVSGCALLSRAPAPTTEGLTVSVAHATVAVGKTVNIKAAASNASDHLLVFEAIVWRKVGWWILKHVRGWKIAKIYPGHKLGASESMKQSYQYKPEKKGNYRVRIKLRDKKGRALVQQEVFFSVN